LTLCRRCQTAQPVITVRSEPLCEACFSKYVHTKIVKRMESFRVRHAAPGQERRLLLPVTFDASSTTLLHILHHHLSGQTQKTGRTGYKLYLVHIEDDSDQQSTSGLRQDSHDPILDRLKQAYPGHEYSSITLSDVLTQASVRELFPSLSEDHASSGSSPAERLQHLLGSLGSATSQADARNLLERRLLVDHAKTHSCEAILWSDSTTKLAEKTLAETAKGRGFSLPWVIADGESPHGVSFYHPLRDLLNQEIEAYISFLGPSMGDIVVKPVVKPAVSTRHTTIDDLMTQYFASVEREYPSIVANVVKTTGKLEASLLREVEQQCELCEMPLDGQAPERSRLCYGCIRTLPSAAG
jgi:cytoplasmic tRNA 2-thiolation protein 2